MSNAITVNDLVKKFPQGKESITVLNKVSLEVKKGESVALMGESGSGKSTLLQIISGIMDFDSGSISLLGNELAKLSDNKKTELRLKHLGFVYQYHHLLSDFSALENVILPQKMLGTPAKKAEQHAKDLLEKLGLTDRLNHRPAELSGGQQQRVAIARALANNPGIIFADEPTGNLDAHNAKAVMDLFIELAAERSTTLVIATHSETISKRTGRIFTL